jgi:hypothetical protein
LVQVTVLPMRTVSVAGTKAKLSMLTASPATGAAGAVTEAEVPAGAPGIDGIPLMPGIPGVAPLIVARVADGEVPDCGDEHPASSSTANSTTRAP